MNEAQVRTLEQVREVLAGTQSLEMRPVADEAGRYAWIETVLKRFDYIVCAVNAAHAQKSVRQNPAFEKGLELVPDQRGQARAGADPASCQILKDALYVRAHYDTMTVTLQDAPMPKEVAIIFCAATRGRLHARLGGLSAKDIQGKDGLR